MALCPQPGAPSPPLPGRKEFPPVIQAPAQLWPPPPQEAFAGSLPPSRGNCPSLKPRPLCSVSDGLSTSFVRSFVAGLCHLPTHTPPQPRPPGSELTYYLGTTLAACALGRRWAKISRWSCLTPPFLPNWLQASGWQPGAGCFPHIALVLTMVLWHWCCPHFTDKDTEATTG